MKAERLPAVLALVLLSCLLSSCSTPSDNKQTIAAENDDGIFVDSATVEADSTREAVYVYGKSSPSDPKEIILTLNAEPFLLGTSYVRLAGVVSGRAPIAVLEISGKGLCLGLGEEVIGYKVLSVSERTVKLIKG